MFVVIAKSALGGAYYKGKRDRRTKEPIFCFFIEQAHKFESAEVAQKYADRFNESHPGCNSRVIEA